MGKQKQVRHHRDYNGTYPPIKALDGREVIGYKKAIKISAPDSTSYFPDERCAIVTLRITAETPRMQPYHDKCRAAKATVLEIRDMLTGRKLETARSVFDRKFIYRVGETVRPTRPFSYEYDDCATGIHFFLLEHAARRYY